MLTAFIVDDEYQSRSFLANLLTRNFPDIDICGQAATVKDGIDGIRSFSPDIVFLDMQMNGETGFDLLEGLTKINFALIITSAFDRFAIRAFRFNAVDYLLKPIILGELAEAIDRIREKSAHNPPVSKGQIEQLYQDMRNPQKAHDKIAIPSSEGFVFVPVSDIVYCRANGNYTEFFFCGKKSLISSYTLRQYDDMLAGQSFFRPHRSYLINLSHVKMYKRGEGGIITMSNGDELELSRTHKDEFLQLLNLKG